MIKTKDIINKFLAKNWKYLLIFFIFCFVFFDMQNLDLGQNEISARSYLDQISGIKNNIYTISNDQGSISTGTVINSNSGDYYRLFFNIKATKDINNVESELRESKIKVILAENGGNTQILPEVSINQDGKVVTKEMIFRTNERFSYLTFQRSDSNYDSEIKIDGIYFSRLSCQTDQCMASLDQTISGNSGDTRIVSEMTSKNDVLYKFGYGKTNFGQIFLAGGDNISAVNIALGVVGSGGLGNYQLTLKKANLQKGKLIVDPAVLASFQFDSSDMDKYQMANNIYRFPLAANLQSGGYYFLAVDNSLIKTNYFNSVKILGSVDKSSYPFGGAYLLGSNKDFGDIFFKIESSRPIVTGGSKIPYNTVIEDLGRGSELYRYKFSRSAADYLDIFQQSSKSDLAAYLDLANGGVLAPASGQMNFSYKFDTLAPFSNMEFKYKQIGGYFVNTIGYYSFDNLNWKQIQPQDPTNGSDWFGQSIAGDGKSHALYLKFTYDPQDIGKNNKAFGVSDLEVTGIINQK